MEDTNIRTAMEAEKEFVKNPLCITAYEQHQKYLRDKHAREEFLRKEGEAIGEARGIAKGKSIGKAEAEKDIIKSLVASGISVEEIASCLNKDVTEIRKLLN